MPGPDAEAPQHGIPGRETWPIGRYWREFCGAIAADVRDFSWDSPRVRRAVTTGLACALAVLTGIVLDLDNPMWSGMTAFTVTQASAAATTIKGLLRGLGTIAGALVGAIALGFIAGSHVELTIALFAGVTYALYRSYLSRYYYAWLLGAITIGLVLMTTMAEPDAGLHIAGYRAAEIVAGVLTAWVVANLLLPEATDPQKDRALIAQPALRSRRAAALAAAEAGIAIVLVVLLYDWFDLPGFSSAAVSMTRIADPDPKLGRRRAFLRAIGCIAGAAAGLCAVGLSFDTLAGLLLVLFIACAVFGYVFAGPPASAYAGMQAGFAFLIAFVEGSGPARALDPAIDRLAGIFLAVAVFWLVDALIGAPGHEER